MSDSNFLNRVVLRNYKSIGYCDVRLGPLICSCNLGRGVIVQHGHLLRRAHHRG